MSEPINYDWEAAVAAWNKPERKKFDDFFTKPESPVGAIPPATTTNVSAYGNKALTEELATLANTNEGQRNDQLNRSAFNLAQLVAAGHLPEIETREQLRATALHIGLTQSETDATLRSGFDTGLQQPRQVQPLGPVLHHDNNVAEVTTETITGDPALRLVEAVDVTISRVRFLWANRIPLGAFTLIPGEEGVGKTTINTWITANVTRGTLPGELSGQPRHVIIIAPEDHREAVVVPRLKEAGADLKLVTFIDARIYGDTEHDIVIPRDLPEIAKVCRQRNTALVQVDSFVTTLPETMKSISYKDIATALKALGNFAETTNVAVLAPWHLNKTSGSDTALRMMDSRAFRTATRSILLAVGDPEKPNEVIVALDKANGASLDTAAVRFKIDTASYTVEEIDQETGEVVYIAATCSVAKYIREEAGNGRDLARKLLTPAMERDNDPKTWLRQYITDHGPTMRDEVIEAAEAAGFSERQMQRAAKALRIRYITHTIKRSNSTPLRKDEWSLPDDDSDDDNDGAATVPPRSFPPSMSGTTVVTEALGRVEMASSSLVRDGGDGHAAHAGVRESGTTANQSGTTANSGSTGGITYSRCVTCGTDQLTPPMRLRGTCGPCHVKQQAAS